MINELINFDTTQGFEFRAVVESQSQLTLNRDEHGLNVTDLVQSLNEGSYELSNVDISFANKDYWASRRFYYDPPFGRKTIIYLISGAITVEVFSGIVSYIQVKPETVTLKLVA